MGTDMAEGGGVSVLELVPSIPTPGPAGVHWVVGLQ